METYDNTETSDGMQNKLWNFYFQFFVITELF